MSLLTSSINRKVLTSEPHLKSARLKMLMATTVLVVVFITISSATPEWALAQSTQWTVTAFTLPTNFSPMTGSMDTYKVRVQNTGDIPSDGSTITVLDTLPNGLRAAGNAYGADWISPNQEMSCSGLRCTYTGVVPVDDFLVLEIPVEVEAGAQTSITNTITVSGGGAPEVIQKTPTTISAAPAPFEITPGSISTSLSNTQAGAHSDLTTSLMFAFNSHEELAGEPKEVVVNLPPGLVGDAADAPRCSIVAFSHEEGGFKPQGCPSATQIGVTTVYGLFLTAVAGFTVPVYNLTTNPGEVARFGFAINSALIEVSISLRPGDYGVRATFRNIDNSITPIAGATLTIWGDPSDSSHDVMRGLICNNIFAEGNCSYSNSTEASLPTPQSSASPPIPYLTSPTQCTGEPLQATFDASSWQEPTKEVRASASLGLLTGCNFLEFPPEITAAADTNRADTPAGFSFDLKVPQEGLVSPTGTSAADIESTTVTLPQGVVINPGQGDGLGACQLSQAAVDAEGPPSCPSNSKVGEVEIETPLIKNKLKGTVYLLQSNPPNLQLLVAPEDPVDGLYVKFIGDVHLNENTGQLVTTFENTPQVPVSNLKLSFSGGAQAALATPTECGIYKTSGIFTPWSGEENALVSSDFPIESGPAGSACSSPLPFAPSLIAGPTNDQAGGFTNFSLLLTRSDGQQRISTLQFKAPEGLLGVISKVTLCGEPEAYAGTCSTSSEIGHTVVEAGPGPYPLVVPQPGAPPAGIYLTGPYDGAPYGLSIVVPVIAGPFNLGTIVVRAKIEVDPNTTQLTVTTSPLPSIIDGIPSDLRAINAVIDRAKFMFNPTNCKPMAFGGTATSTDGTSAPISSRTQVGSCRSLEFKPKLTVSTSGKTSRAHGASLDVKLTYPSGAFGKDANIAKVKVDLPKQLPSRLTTLQKACVDTVFDANPSGCPSASRVGEATAVTPVLSGALHGIAYFVSHGGEKFPELVIVLQGDGVTVDLHGETFIKGGITSSTFRTVPDVPVENFELKLPQGSNSALGANGNLCKSKLVMPTAFEAQSGLMIHQSTTIAVTGCPKHKVTSTRLRKKAKK